jgi:hypothetical protein
MMASPLMQRNPSLRRTSSLRAGMQKRTNWTAIVVLLTVSHLSATFVYYVFIAEKEVSKGGATGAKKVRNILFAFLLLSQIAKTF